MAAKIKYGEFSIGTTGNKTISGVGFEPGLVIFFYRGSTSSNVSRWSIGAATNYNGVIKQASSVHAVNDSNADMNRDSRTTRCILSRDANGTFSHASEFTGVTSDGFTLNTTTAIRSVSFSYIAFEKSVKAEIRTITIGSSAGTETITDIPFKPKSLLTSFLPGNTLSNSGLMLGVCREDLTQTSYSVNGNSSGALLMSSRYDTTNVFQITEYDTTNYSNAAEVTNWTNDGFTIQRKSAPSNRTYFYIAFGDNVDLDYDITNFSGTGAGSITYPFEPDAILTYDSPNSSLVLGGIGAAAKVETGQGTAQGSNAVRVGATLSRDNRSWLRVQEDGGNDLLSQVTSFNGKNIEYNVTTNNVGIPRFITIAFALNKTVKIKDPTEGITRSLVRTKVGGALRPIKL